MPACPPPPRPLDLGSFAEAAAMAGAVVVVAARGGLAEAGGLQALLELYGVPFTGDGGGRSQGRGYGRS